MEKKINIAELLKDCPKGTELYSPLFGELKFEGISHTLILCQDVYRGIISFEYDGKYIPKYHNAECMLFPSKDQRDWSKFQSPFKDGDILVSSLGNPFIFKKLNEYNSVVVHCALNNYGRIVFGNDNWTEIVGCKLATEEEKEKLFQAIKANGYKWNAETKTLEKLPRFKEGDKVRGKYCNNIYTISCITSEGYELTNRQFFPFNAEVCYELAPNKFDITTLKPFDKVLVRDKNNDKWKSDFWGFYDIDNAMNYPYECCGNSFAQCIPYEGNEHLLGTTNDCDEFYKTW